MVPFHRAIQRITTEATFITQGNKPHLASTSEKRDAIFIAAANPAVVLELLAELEAKDKRIAELEAKTAMTMGVGSGNGNLFVHGDYDSIKAAQAIVLENESLRAKLATPVRLPEPCVYEVNGTRFYDRLSEAEVIASLREQGFTVEGDS